MSTINKTTSNALKQYKTSTVAALIATTLAVLTTLTASPALAGKTESGLLGKRVTATTVERTKRLQHAQELLGSYYKSSIVRFGERVSDVNQFVYQRTEQGFKGIHKKHARKCAETIIAEAHRYGFDPLFLLAVIQTESRFRPEIRGSFGEIGLMQIKPTTAAWVAKKMKMKWKGDNSLFDPSENVKFGAAYFSMLRDTFDSQSRLYIAAYNMGTTNVNRARERKVWPTIYPVRIMQNYVGLYRELASQRVASPKTRAAASPLSIAVR